MTSHRRRIDSERAQQRSGNHITPGSVATAIAEIEPKDASERTPMRGGIGDGRAGRFIGSSSAYRVTTIAERHRQNEQEEVGPGSAIIIIARRQLSRSASQPECAVRCCEPLEHRAPERHPEPCAEQRAAIEDKIRGVPLLLRKNRSGGSGQDDRRKPGLANRDPDRRGEQTPKLS